MFEKAAVTPPDLFSFFTATWSSGLSAPAAKSHARLPHLRHGRDVDLRCILLRGEAHPGLPWPRG